MSSHQTVEIEKIQKNLRKNLQILYKDFIILLPQKTDNEEIQ